MHIRKLRLTDVHPTAHLLAAAFLDNPCYGFMHPRESSRLGDLQSFFDRNLRWHLPQDLTWIVEDEAGQVLATTTLEPPGGVEGSALSLVKHWVVPTLADQGLTTLRRIVLADREFKQRYYDYTQGRPYWHVHAVAVASAQQGKGVGRLLVGHVLGELKKLHAQRPAPVVLSTQRERNIGFYRSFGFELVGEQRMGKVRGELGFTSWFMVLPSSL